MMETNNNIGSQKDDGSLSFLNIPPDENSKQFNCPVTTQQKLINTTFWLVDYFEGIKTKHGDNRYLVKTKLEPDSREEECQKFFTNSKEIKYILDKIRELNAFPRQVTMRASGSRYYLE